MHRFNWIAVGVIVLALCLPSSASVGESKLDHPFVVLAWDASGDFGPETSGTTTAGWQEAVDCCVANGHDLYVKGGWGGRKAIYHVSDTIRIPATQDFRIDGGVYVVNWIGPPDDPAKDLMRIDSAMNAEYHFGIFVYGGAGAALRIQPENPVPIDGFPVVVETEIKSQGIADPSPFTPGERKPGTGLVLDGTKASIVNSRFDFVGGILNFKTCVEVKGGFAQNRFSCLHLHTNADNSTLFVLGPKASQNIVDLAIGVDMGAANVRGLAIHGRNNAFTIMTRGGFPGGNDVVLESTAAGNRIDLLHGGGSAPLAAVTDNADAASNQVTWVGGNLPIRTQPVPLGEHVYTQRLYPATVRVVGGEVSNVTLVRGSGAADCTSSCRDGVLMSVDDQLRVHSTAAPELQIIPFKVR